MPYFAQADVEARFTVERVAEVFSVQQPDGSSTGAADATTFNACVADAQAIIDAKIGEQYATPLTLPIDAEIVRIGCNLIMWVGIQRHPEWLSSERWQPYKMLFDAAKADLEEIRKDTRRISAARVPANAGGMVNQTNDDNAQPFYFVRNPADGTGGMTGY